MVFVPTIFFFKGAPSFRKKKKKNSQKVLLIVLYICRSTLQANSKKKGNREKLGQKTLFDNAFLQLETRLGDNLLGITIGRSFGALLGGRVWR